MKFKTLLISLLLLTFLPVANADFMAVALVSKIHGTALINKEKIKVGSEIAQGMNLVIPKSSDFIDVKFQNGHIVRFVGANVKFETINPKTALFNLLKGKIYSEVKPMTQDESFNVKTDKATFGFNATKAMIENNKKQTYVCVSEGPVLVKSSTGEITVNKGEDLSLAKAKSILKSTVAAKSIIAKLNEVLKDMAAQ